MPEYFDAKEITPIVAGKSVKRVVSYDSRSDEYIQIDFEDGTSLRFLYDWIYEWNFGKTIDFGEVPAT